MKMLIVAELLRSTRADTLLATHNCTANQLAAETQDREMGVEVDENN
jgi:hypothetical protein